MDSAFCVLRVTASPRLWTYSTMLSYRFIILAFIFRSMIYLELSFIMDWSSLHFGKLFHHHLLKRLSFLHWPYMYWPTFGISKLSHWYVFLSLGQCHTILITVSLYFIKKIFLCGPFEKFLLNLLQYCFLFLCVLFGWEVCGILVLQPGIEPHPLYWKVNSLPLDYSECPNRYNFKGVFWTCREYIYSLLYLILF